MRGLLHRRDQRGGIVAALIVFIFVAALCALVYFARHPILRFLAESWVVDEPVAHADAVLLLGDDNFYADCATHAAQLIRQGDAPLVVASGRRLRPGAGISELLEHDLVERGVPKEKIIRFAHDADGLRDEADGLAKLAAQNNWKSVIVVTSNYRARRTRYVFQRVFPSRVSVRVSSARDGDFDPEHWWEKRKSANLLGSELLELGEAWWDMREQSAGSPDSPTGTRQEGY